MSALVYFVRHGEVEHHRTDVSLTARGVEQARAAGVALARSLAAGDAVFVLHSPLARVRETANVLHESLADGLRGDGRAARLVLHPPQPDAALLNPRFYLEPDQEPQEPSLLYAAMNVPGYFNRFAAARTEFYRGFWASDDPMGYWLAHDSAGGAETPALVVARLTARLGEIFSRDNVDTARYIMVTSSGAMRALLRQAFGADPGEPDFCEVIAFQRGGRSDGAVVSYRGRSALLALC